MGFPFGVVGVLGWVLVVGLLSLLCWVGGGVPGASFFVSLSLSGLLLLPVAGHGALDFLAVI